MYIWSLLQTTISKWWSQSHSRRLKVCFFSCSVMPKFKNSFLSPVSLSVLSKDAIRFSKITFLINEDVSFYCYFLTVQFRWCQEQPKPILQNTAKISYQYFLLVPFRMSSIELLCVPTIQQTLWMHEKAIYTF